MSIGQTFPDVLYLGDSRYRIITEGGFSWVHHNTKIGTKDIPRELLITGDSEKLIRDMKADGLIVRPA